MKGEQLALSVQLRSTASFETYHAGPNHAAVDALKSGRTSVYLFGPSGSGKTHLLQAAVRAGQQAGRHVAYVPLADLAAAGPDILEGLDRCELLALDDLDRVTADRDWALALLRLIDRLGAQGHGWLAAATAAAARLETAMPDLRTRLALAAGFGLRSLDDDERARWLVDSARARGLILPGDVTRWLLTHRSRDMTSLVEILDRLDRASLSARRRLTLPFVQQVLGNTAADAR